MTSTFNREVFRGAPTRRVLLALDYYLHQTHRGVVDYARQAGWILDARTHHLGGLPDGWEADGILAFIGSNDLLGPALRGTGLPLVNMSPWRSELRIPTVQLDNRAAGAAAAEHLIGRGFQHLAMLQFTPRSPTSGARRQGFEAAALAAGRQFYPLVCPLREEESGPQALLAWLRQTLIKLPNPLGVFTEGDLWAVELIHVCQQAGLAVPDQVAVVGIDNDPLVVDVAPVALSSVDNDLRGLGFRAAELLDQLMAGQAAPDDPILIPPIGVVQRQSTNIVAVPDDDLATAIRYIQAHFAEPITVDDVADQTVTSRRRLQDLFTTHLGRTITDELKRCRLDLAKRLLKDTGLKVDAIAERAGFGNAVQMTKVFTRELGVGPAGYRTRYTVR